MFESSCCVLSPSPSLVGLLLGAIVVGAKVVGDNVVGTFVGIFVGNAMGAFVGLFIGADVGAIFFICVLLFSFVFSNKLYQCCAVYVYIPISILAPVFTKLIKTSAKTKAHKKKQKLR